MRIFNIITNLTFKKTKSRLKFNDISETVIKWFYYSSINPWKLYRQHLSNSKLFCYRCSIIGSVVVVVGLYLFLWSKSKQIVDSKIVKLPTSTVEEEKEEEDHTNVNKLGRLLVIPMTPWSTYLNPLFIQKDRHVLRINYEEEKKVIIWLLLENVLTCVTMFKLLNFTFQWLNLGIVIFFFK